MGRQNILLERNRRMVNGRLEYGVARNPNDWVATTRSLTDAINAAATDKDKWRIYERTVTNWTEVE